MFFNATDSFISSGLVSLDNLLTWPGYPKRSPILAVCVQSYRYIFTNEHFYNNIYLFRQISDFTENCCDYRFYQEYLDSAADHGLCLNLLHQLFQASSYSA